MLPGPMHAACSPSSGRLAHHTGMDRYELAAILKDVGNFSMDDYEGRIALQRTVCILQAFGVDLGYRFGWYLHGPYCKALFRDGHEAGMVAGGLPEAGVSFEGEETQERYERFKEFMRGKGREPALLGTGASICHLAAAGIDRDAVLDAAADRAELGRGRCATMWDELEGYGVVGDGTA